MNELKAQNTDSDESTTQVLLAQLSPGMKNINVVFRVVSIGMTRKVISRSSGNRLMISEVTVGDHTGTIILVLWNDDVDTLAMDNTYLLKGGVASVYDGCMQLTKGREAEIVPSTKAVGEVEIANDMSRPFALNASKRKRHRSDSGKPMNGERGREAKGYCTWKGF